jgi:5-methylcytosine-specific restriction protein B
MNYKEHFIDWLDENLGDGSGAKSSYIAAIDILSGILNYSIFEVDNIDELKLLYKDVLANQGDENGKYFNSKAPSYGTKRFYSASLKNYIKFLENESNVSKIAKKLKMELFDYNTFSESSKNSGLTFSKNLVLRFIASLTSKPFVILSGLSGSGKTKIAQSFVQWICESNEQYKIVPVGADWTNREPLVGYPNGLVAEEYITPDSGVIHLLMEAVKKENENKPFFLILDEMNLSHVERYFADFLSIMESNDTIKLYTGNTRESLDGLPVPLELGWPKNVFIIGTVNIDETTYMFSPKVLDRANVIEFRITADEIKSFLGDPGIPDLTKLTKQGVAMSESFLWIASQNNIVKNEVIAKELVSFFNQLKPVGAEFGYRSATEIMQLAAKLKMLEPTITDNACLDIAIMQKLLPKLHGSRSKLVDVLIALGEICLVDAKDCKTIYFDAIKIDDLTKNTNIKYPISFEKLIRMYKNVLANGFTSYAEA